MNIKRNAKILYVVLPVVIIVNILYFQIYRKTDIIKSSIISSLIGGTILIRKYKKNHFIMYESSGDGFYIAGIKGGFYDPDFIKYDDIEEITMEHKNIRLLAKDGKRITLINMGRKINIIYHDMIDKLEKNEVRPDCT